MPTTRKAPGDARPGGAGPANVAKREVTGGSDGMPSFLTYDSRTGEAVQAGPGIQFYKGGSDRRRRPPQAHRLPPVAMTVDFWGDNPHLYDTVQLDDVTLQGLCEVGGENLERKIDAKSAAGSDGGTIRDKGYDLTKFKVTVHLWTRFHHEFWLRLLPSLDPRKRGAERRPRVVLHPALYEAGIVRGYITGITIPKPSGRVKGGMEITISFIEYAPPTPATRSVTRTVKDTGASTTTSSAVGGASAPPATTTPADDTGP